MTEPRQIRLHLGAHKTASTHLQRSLQRHRPTLVELGIDYIPPRELREAIRRQPHWLALPGGRVRALRAAIASLGGSLPVLAISEENLLGNVADALSPRPYPTLETRCAVMARALAPARPELCLAIRSFERFWPSCHVETLRTGGTPPPLVTPADAPSWLDICRRVRRAFAGAPLTVWRQEDYDAQTAATAFLGRDPGPLPGVARFSRRESPSAEGVRRALAVAGDADAVGAIFAARPAAWAEPFRPFDAATEARLRDAYARDLVALAVEPGVRLLSTGVS